MEEFKRWFFDNQIASVDCFDMCYEAWTASTMAERERCARIAESVSHDNPMTAQDVADAIRAAKALVEKRL